MISRMLDVRGRKALQWITRCTVLLGLLGAAALPAQATTPPSRVFIGEFRVVGNTVLDTRDIERTVYPFLGPHGGLERVQAAAEALEALYRERGYPTVGVAAPTDARGQARAGVVVLTVFEQPIERMRVTGARFHRHQQVREEVTSVQPGAVLHAPSMQAELDRLSRRSADRVVRPVLRAGATPGQLDVELQVEDRLPLHAGVELNNYASANTSDLRLSATASYANLFQRQSTLVLTGQTSPEEPSEVKVFSATYLHRPRDSSMVYAFTGVKSDSAVASVGGVDVLGSGEFLIARAIVPLRSTAERSDVFVFGADYKNSEDITAFERQLTDDVTRDEIDIKKLQYMAFTAGYDLEHAYRGGRNRYALSAHAGVRGLFNDRDEFEAKRFKGEPNFFYLKFGLGRTQPLSESLELDLALDGQLTPDQLIGNEQMSFGGVRSVRGYLESEVLGDYGARLGAELRWTGLAPLAGRLPITPYLFWDSAYGARNEPLPDEGKDFTLSSVGLGLRLPRVRGVAAEASFAYLLEDAGVSSQGDGHLSFRLAYDR